MRCLRACHTRFVIAAGAARKPQVKVVSPSTKLVADALKGLRVKPKAPKRVGPERWEDIVRDSRRLLKRSVRLRDLVHRQVARYQDTNDVEGRKYNGWWSIWDVLKGVKSGRHYTKRSKEINRDVGQIMAPSISSAENGPYGPIVSILKGADESFSTKFTKRLGSPTLDLSADPKFDGYVEKPLPGARIKTIPYNPVKPYEPLPHKWKKTPPLSRLPELIDEDYNNNLKPVYAPDFKIKPKKAPQPEIPFPLKRKNWDYPQIPYTYPVTMVKHNPKTQNPHVRPPTPGWHAEWPEFRFKAGGTTTKEASEAEKPSAAEAAAEPAAAVANTEAPKMADSNL